MSVAPPALVAAPARPPLPYGLFSVLAPRDGSTDRWQAGIQFEELGCPPAATGIIGPYACGEDAIDGLPKEFDGNADTVTASEFTVYTSQVCSPIGNSLERSTEIASGRMALFEERLVETALWAILQDVDIKATILAADKKDEVLRKIAALEQAASNAYGTQGVVHMPRETALLGIGYSALDVRQNRLFTQLGTPVVAGSGYTHTTGSAAVFWTPQMVGYRSEVFNSTARAGDLLDRASNDLYGVAERTWVLAFDTSCGVIVPPEPEPDPDPNPNPIPN